jgi:hypothetical protein
LFKSQGGWRVILFGMSVAQIIFAVQRGSGKDQASPGGSAIRGEKMVKLFVAALLCAVLSGAGCSSPMTTREQGGLIGAGVGAGTGAIIGSTVGHAAVGALIGGPVGLVAGALIGDQFMAQERRQDEQQQDIDRNRSEIERLRRENERLRGDLRER